MKSHLLDALPLAAQDRLNNQLQNMARGFQGKAAHLDSGELAIFLAIVAGVVTGLWLLAYWIERREGRSYFDSSLGLFLSLSREHGLKWHETWLLWRIARGQGLREPSRLFLEPERFKPDRLMSSFSGRAEAIQAIARRLFCDLTDQPEKPDGA
jgi:hypothetical protein